MLYPVLATVMYSLRAFYGKKLINDGMSKYSMQLSMRFYGLLVLVVIAFFQRNSVNFSIFQTNRGSFTVLFAVFLGMGGLTLMYEVLSKMEVSNFAVTKSFSPIITVVLSFMVLGERLSLISYVGVLLVILSIIGISTLKEGRVDLTSARVNAKNIGLLALAFGMMSGSNILYKMVSDQITPLSYAFVLFFINISVFTLYVYLRERASLKKVFSFNKDLVILGTVATLALFFFITAFTTTSPTIANTIAQMQVFIIIFLGYVFFKEKTDLKIKSLLATVSVVGIILVVNF